MKNIKRNELRPYNGYNIVGVRFIMHRFDIDTPVGVRFIAP
jgi:hypothetical protein